MEFNVSQIVIDDAVKRAVRDVVENSIRRERDFDREVKEKLTSGVKRADLSEIPGRIEKLVTEYINSDRMVRLVEESIERELKSSFSNAFKGAVKAIAVAKGRQFADQVCEAHRIAVADTPIERLK